MAVAPVTTGAVLVFALIGVAVVLFVTEAVPPDVTALGVLVAIAVLEPWTGVGADDAIAGFANPATVTIMAMYVVSEGVQRTGVVERLGAAIGRLTGDDERRLLGATVATTGLSAGVVNNTPVVAVFIPMITDLADRAGISRSRLLMPLSFAAMLGGTLTLLGTATNLLASAIATRMGVPGAPFGMFQFTPVGLVVLLVGGAYLLVVAPHLLPERVPPVDLTDDFELGEHLWRVGVRERSPLVGEPVDAALGDHEAVDVLQLVRDDEVVLPAETDRLIEPDDVLVVRGSEAAVRHFAIDLGLRRVRGARVDDTTLAGADLASDLVEAVVPPDSGLVGGSVADARLGERFDTTVLAVRRGESLVREGIGDWQLQAGDALLLQTREYAIDYLVEEGDLLVTKGSGDVHETLVEEESEGALSPRTPVAVGILAAVVLLAAVDAVPVVIAALGGVVAMVVTGCVSTTRTYETVSWNVVFLLAGILPLGVALRRTGGADLIASAMVAAAAVLPVVVVLGLFYLLTGLFSNVITPVASVVLLLPVAVETATGIGADPLPFAFAVTFGAATAFMTPVGYQTNLMVYGPGGYRFTDYVRVGAPLQLLLAVVTTLAIAVMWPP